MGRTLLVFLLTPRGKLNAYHEAKCYFIHSIITNLLGWIDATHDPILQNYSSLLSREMEWKDPLTILRERIISIRKNEVIPK